MPVKKSISIFTNVSAESTSGFTTAFEVTDNSSNASTFVLNGMVYTGNGTDYMSTVMARQQQMMHGRILIENQVHPL